MNFLHTHTQRLLSVFVLSLALSACSSGTDDPPMPPDIVDDLPTPSTEPEEPIGSGAVPITCVEANAAPVADAEDAPYFAFATGLAPNAPGNSIGRLLRVSVSETPVLSGCAFRAGADIQVATDGTSVYEIGAGLLDSISQFDVDSLEENYRYSVKGLDVSANPQDIEFLNNNKAYVIRYDSSSLWIVNPSATTEEDFYLGEINLSAYGSYHSYDADSGVQMIDAEIVDGKLFVLLQRLQDASAPLDAYVVVIDTESDTEISTGQGADGLNGIRLDVGDTQRLFFNEETNDVMVIGRGYLSDYEDIGLVAIDANDYSRDLILDEMSFRDIEPLDPALLPFYIFDAIIVNSEKGYIISDTLDVQVDPEVFEFNPVTGRFNLSPGGDDGAFYIGGILSTEITSLTMGPDGYVWIGVGPTEPGFVRLDPNTSKIVGERILTEFMPRGLVFVKR